MLWLRRRGGCGTLDELGDDVGVDEAEEEHGLEDSVA